MNGTAKRFVKTWTEKGKTYSLKMEAELSWHKGNNRPYFSLTGELIENGRAVAWGCMHEEALEHFPELKPLVDLHLCNDEGVPSHCGANVLYWLQQSLRNEYGKATRERYRHAYDKHKDSEYYFNLFCKDMHISKEQGEEYRQHAEKFWSDPSRLVQLCGRAQESVTVILFKSWWSRIFEEQKPRWKAEAEDAIRTFGLEVVRS